MAYWGLTPQQQTGSYRGGDDDDDNDDDDEMSDSLVEETGVPGGNHRDGGGLGLALKSCTANPGYVPL